MIEVISSDSLKINTLYTNESIRIYIANVKGIILAVEFIEEYSQEFNLVICDKDDNISEDIIARGLDQYTIKIPT
jgi:hypothetical protein